MADTAMSLGSSAANAAYEAAAARYVEQSAGQHNEVDVKKAVLSELQQVKDDTAALRNVHFKTARDELASWQQSTEPIESDSNRNLLRCVRANAALAINAVPDPLDKMAAISFLIHADYHLAALDGAGPDWAAGKRVVQSRLRQYAEMGELTDAAKEELGITSRLFLRNREKRRKLLRSFINLSAAVFHLPPTTIASNAAHPRFKQLEEAVLHACREDQQLMWSSRIRHIITEPTERSTLKGHANSVFCCVVSADGMRAVSGSWDETLKVWNLTSGSVIRTLVGHTGPVFCCAASGKRAVSGSDDKTLKVWDIESGAEVRTLHGHNGSVWCCALYAGGTRAISGGYDHTLRVWDLGSGEEIRSLKGHTDGVNCCTIFAGGERAISGSGDRTLKVWDLPSGTEIHTLEGHTKAVECCAVTADGSKTISGSEDCTLRVWDVASGMEIRSLEGHTDSVYCCTIYAGGRRVVSGSDDHTLKVWDLANGVAIHTLRGHTHGVYCCAVSADGTRLVSGSWDNTLKVWDMPMEAVP